MTLRFTRLDRISLRRLTPGQKITEHGIIAEALESGAVRYSINIMADGQRIHRVVGLSTDGVNRTQAEQLIAKLRTEAREGRLSLPKGRKTHWAFSTAADSYVKKLREIDGKNVNRKESQLAMHLKPFFGSQTLDTITTFTVEKYKKKRRDAEATNGTINRELATLNHFFSMAVEWQWIRLRPCKIAMLAESQGRIVALTDDQATALLDAALADSEPDCWLFVEFGLNTSMRHQEILRARFDQLDLEHLRLFLPTAKAGQREQPITPELAAILKREREMRDDKDGWIFASPRPKATKKGHRDRMDRPFARAAKAAGLNPEVVTPHTMRHTAITKLVKAGVDLPTIQRISGHKTLAMVLRYTHVHGGHIDAAISHLGRAVPSEEQFRSRDAITQELHIKRAKRKKRGADVVKIRKRYQLERMVPGDGVEPPTRGFSIRCSTN